MTADTEWEALRDNSTMRRLQQTLIQDEKTII
jgi:hypothetical protein